jgi:hypothetical protein
MTQSPGFLKSLTSVGLVLGVSEQSALQNRSQGLRCGQLGLSEVNRGLVSWKTHQPHRPCFAEEASETGWSEKGSSKVKITGLGDAVLAERRRRRQDAFKSNQVFAAVKRVTGTIKSS